MTWVLLLIFPFHRLGIGYIEAQSAAHGFKLGWSDIRDLLSVRRKDGKEGRRKGGRRSKDSGRWHAGHQSNFRRQRDSSVHREESWA